MTVALVAAAFFSIVGVCIALILDRRAELRELRREFRQQNDRLADQLSTKIAAQGSQLRDAMAEQGSQLRTEIAAQGGQLRDAMAEQGSQLHTEIAAQGSQLRTEISEQGSQLRDAMAEQSASLDALRAEMRQGFAEVGSRLSAVEAA